MNESAIEYYKHLRSIQFYLLLVCVVLLAISSLMRASFIHEAYKDLSNIKSFVEEYYQKGAPWFDRDLTKDYLEDYVSSILNSSTINHSDFPSGISIIKDGKKELWYIHLQYDIRDISWVVNADVEVKDISGIIPDGQTLDSFKAYWNSLYYSNLIFIPTSVENALLYDNESERLKIYPVKEVTDPEKYDVYAFSLTPVSTFTKNWKDECLPKKIFGDWHGDLEKIKSYTDEYVLCLTPSNILGISDPYHIFPQMLVLPVSVITINYNPLEKIIERSGYTDWNVRPFPRAFIELYEVTKGYSDIPLDKLHTILKSERDRTGEGINIFGVHVSSYVARDWGAFAILAVQLYFFLHMMAFPKNNLNEVTIPWIALYKTIPSKLVFILSSIIFPPVTISVLLFSSWYLGNSSVIYWICIIIAILLSSLLSVFTYAYWRRLHSNEVCIKHT